MTEVLIFGQFERKLQFCAVKNTYGCFVKSIYFLLKSRKLRSTGHMVLNEGHTANAYKDFLGETYRDIFAEGSERSRGKLFSCD
jgi:hypothetical protein